MVIVVLTAFSILVWLGAALIANARRHARSAPAGPPTPDDPPGVADEAHEWLRHLDGR